MQKLDFRHEAGASEATRSRDTLFLDQAIESAVGAARAQTIRRRTAEYVNALGGRVFYKPHYAQGRVATRDRSWTPLDPTLNALPAEWVVARMGFANVVSFFTSALVNIAMGSGTTTCHATAAGVVPVSVDGRATNLGEVLSGLGVTVVDLSRA